MEPQFNDLKIGLEISCIVILWILQRYYTLNRPLGGLEKFTTITVGVFAGTGIARLLQLQNLLEAFVLVVNALQMTAIVVVVGVIIEAAYNVIMSLVALRKT